MHLARVSALLLAHCFLLAAGPTAIRDVTLIDGTGARERPHSTIVFRGDRILAIGQAKSIRIPKGTRVIDGRGKYVIPGLWDMHVHLWDKENVLPIYVAFGVTGVRDMGSDYARTSAWRRAIESGKAIGPHIITSGPAVGGEASVDPKLPVIVAKTPVEARTSFDRLYDMNVDFAKVLSSLPRDAYFALAEQCRHWRIPLAGNVPTNVRALEAIEERQASIEHLFGLFLACSTEEWYIRAGKVPPGRALETFSETLAHELFRRSALFETRQTPTLTLWERMARVQPERLVHNPALQYVPEAIRKTWPGAGKQIRRTQDPEVAGLRKQFALAKKMVRLMKEVDVPILAGTDTGDPYTVPGETLHRELELLVEAGLTPAEALQSATSEAARFIGWEGAVGTLQTGAAPDLVVLNADPLADIANVRKISGVAFRGRYLDRSGLNALLQTHVGRLSEGVRAAHSKARGGRPTSR